MHPTFFIGLNESCFSHYVHKSKGKMFGNKTIKSEKADAESPLFQTIQKLFWRTIKIRLIKWMYTQIRQKYVKTCIFIESALLKRFFLLIIFVRVGRICFTLFCDFQRSLSKHVSEKIEKCLFVGNSGAMSVVCHRLSSAIYLCPVFTYISLFIGLKKLIKYGILF